MARLHEMIKEALPDLVCLHVLLSFASPGITRPHHSTVWLPVAFPSPTRSSAGPSGADCRC
jgi:hypothetical protein